ncbi:hypothetical protein MLD38_012317 [Melastoma candidum]|uniref:Uncharacterized protein n=1 Tax=Melastoma candidum TaxID=119954 RepID=A0ACB9R5I9_9MYRT|nr:hypothetical protein MLD38_012317 [Melastoma candidum]
MVTSRALMLCASMMLILHIRGSECQILGMPLPLPDPEPVPPPALRPLCISQFRLVNHACSLLPFTPGPPPSPPVPPPNPPSPPDNSRFGMYHGHRWHHHIHQGPSQVKECCRWLNEVDDQCVCELLTHLPLFLARPVHEYHVIVPDTCDVIYSCDGRPRQ